MFLDSAEESNLTRIVSNHMKLDGTDGRITFFD